MTLSADQVSAYQAQLRSAIEDADQPAGVELALTALGEGVSPLAFFREVIEPVLKDIGDAFARLDIFLPDLMKAGVVVKAMQTQALEPAIRQAGGQSTSAGLIVFGTCQGDIHDIGKTLVGTMLSAAGFQVYDLGVDVPVMKLVEKAREVNADIIGVSALLTTTMVRQRDVVEALEDLGLRSQIKVMVGGAPVTGEWVREIGADGYSEDAIGAVQVARRLLGK